MVVEILIDPPLALDSQEKIPIVETVETAPRWQTVAKRREVEIQMAIPKEYIVPPHLFQKTNNSKLVQTCGLLSPRELSIISLTATKLLEYIHNQTFTALKVTRAFCKSAAIAHQAASSSKIRFYHETDKSSRLVAWHGSCSRKLLSTQQPWMNI